MQTREEHLSWCKKRALEYIERGEINTAFMSFISDMGKHPETADHVALMLGFQLQLKGLLDTADEMKIWIEGFN